MTSFPFKHTIEADDTTAAAQWALRQSAGNLSEGEERRFAEWLDQHADNAVAYVDAVWALDAVAHHAGEPEILELRNAALAARGSRRNRWTLLGGGMLAAAAAGLFAWVSLPPQTLHSPPATEQLAQRKVAETGVFRTGIGEKAEIELPDGSVATLDTDSEMRVAYSSRARTIHLLSGQALFQVAHGQPQPFQVFARGQRITAVGTVFNVRIAGPTVRVSMVEGVIRLRRDDLSDAEGQRAADLTLTAGETAVAGADRTASVASSVDIHSATSWKGGMLVFNDTPLLEAVAEINRYTLRPIAIADPAVGAYRVSGVFRTNDAQHFSQAMTEILPVELARAPDGAPMLRARKD